MRRNTKKFKIRQWIASVCCIAAIIILSAAEPSAAMVETDVDAAAVTPRTTVASFTKAFVDSNSYTYITQGTMTVAKTYAEVQITNIYDAKGNTSDYKYVKIKATANGEEKKVKVGNTWTKVSIPSNCQFAGMSLPMLAMGNDPSLDCKITGYWMVY